MGASGSFWAGRAWVGGGPSAWAGASGWDAAGGVTTTTGGGVAAAGGWVTGA